jgi:hypothetical protein
MNKDIQLQPLSTLKASAEPPTTSCWQAPGETSGRVHSSSPPPQLESGQNRILPPARTLTVRKMEEKMTLVQNFIMKKVVFGSREYVAIYRFVVILLRKL